MSILFPHCDHLEICGHQDFATGMSTVDNRSATNFRDIIKISVGSLCYKITRRVKLCAKLKSYTALNQRVTAELAVGVA
jgi:hypothetical protein